MPDLPETCIQCEESKRLSQKGPVEGRLATVWLSWTPLTENDDILEGYVQETNHPRTDSISLSRMISIEPLLVAVLTMVAVNQDDSMNITSFIRVWYRVGAQSCGKPMGQD